MTDVRLSHRSINPPTKKALNGLRAYLLLTNLMTNLDGPGVQFPIRKGLRR